MSRLTIKRALISVYYKDHLVKFAQFLQDHGVEILSTGGTYNMLKENQIRCIPIDEFTGSKEILGGRVKTLHPIIHGGILNKRDDEAVRLNLQNIDLVIVNFYPFENLVSTGEKSLNNLIEMIDIGGPTMLRSAAKNHQYVCPVPAPEFYEQIMQEIKDGGITPETRLNMAVEIFKTTAYYDAVIARTIQQQTGYDKKITLPLIKEMDLRYGENPHQTAAYYSIPGSKDEKISDFFTKGKLHGKEISYNNIQDISACMRILSDLALNSCVVIKHTNPCGAASKADTHQSFLAAYEGDKVSIFGGIVGFKGDMTKETADALHGIFLDIIIARSYSPDCLELLKKRKNTIILEYQNWENAIFSEDKFYESKRVMDGFILQSKDNSSGYSEEFKCVTQMKPQDSYLEDLKFAQTIVKHIKSNAIVVVKDKMILGVGAGQLNRVTSARLALDWAGEKSKGAILASDAYFPMDDTVRLAAERGIAAIIQPGGSIKDQDSINACNELGVSMIFTGKRHFLH